VHQTSKSRARFHFSEQISLAVAPRALEKRGGGEKVSVAIPCWRDRELRAWKIALCKLTGTKAAKPAVLYRTHLVKLANPRLSRAAIDRCCRERGIFELINPRPLTFRRRRQQRCAGDVSLYRSAATYVVTSNRSRRTGHGIFLSLSSPVLSSPCQSFSSIYLISA